MTITQTTPFRARNSRALAAVEELRCRAERLELESSQRQTTIYRYEETLKTLQDELDVTRQQLQEAKANIGETDDSEAGLSFEEEMRRAQSAELQAEQRRLTLSEQRMVICQLGELVRMQWHCGTWTCVCECVSV